MAMRVVLVAAPTAPHARARPSARTPRTGRRRGSSCDHDHLDPVEVDGSSSSGASSGSTMTTRGAQSREDVAHLGRAQPGVDGDEDRARRGHAVVRLEDAPARSGIGPPRGPRAPHRRSAARTATRPRALGQLGVRRAARPRAPPRCGRPSPAAARCRKLTGLSAVREALASIDAPSTPRRARSARA